MKLTVTNVIQNLSEKTKNRKGKTHMQWLFVVLLCIPVLNCGMHIGWPAYVTKVLQSDKSPIGTPLSILDISWLTSLPNISALPSLFLWPILIDKCGRKASILICAIIQIVSWVLTLLAANMTTLMVGRIIGGIGDGGCSFTSAVYIKELSNDEIRGTLGMLWNIARNIGILAIYLMGSYVTFNVISWISLIISITGLLGILILPESPSYHIKIGKIENATKTIATLRSLKADSEDVQCVVNSIRAQDEKFKSLTNISFMAIRKQKAWCKGFIIMILLITSISMGGGYTILSYAPTILEMLKVTVNPELLGLGVPISIISGSLLTMVLIERFGRRPILMVSFTISVVSFCAMAGILMVQKYHILVAPDWLSVTVLVAPVCVFAAVILPMVFIIATESFNFQIRTKVIACIAIVNRVGFFIQTFIFGPMSDACGPQATFMLYAAFNFCGILIVLILLPETRSKTVEEIELELEKKLQRRH